MTLALDVIMVVGLAAVSFLLWKIGNMLDHLQNDVDLLFDVFDKEVPEILADVKNQPYTDENGLYSFDAPVKKESDKLKEGEWIK